MQFTRREILIAGCTLTAACRSGARKASSAQFRRTITSNYFGMHYASVGDRQFDDAAASWTRFGASSIRIWNLGLNWRQIEPAQGEFDWALFDKLMDRAAAAGMDVLYVLGQSPDWAAGPYKGRFGPTYNPIPPRSNEDWANYVGAVARRYRGRIRAYELWNEANLKDFFSGDPEQLVQLAKVARDVLRREDPAAILLGPSVTGSQGGRGGPDYMANLLRLGLGSQIDGIAVHLYVDPRGPDAIYDLMEQYWHVLQSAGLGHLPVWNTEFTVHGFRQGMYYTEAPGHLLAHSVAIASVIEMLVIAWLSRCERSYWYGFDDPWSAIQLISRDAQRQLLPAGEAYRALSRLTVGATVLDHSRSNGTWLVTLEKKGETFWLAWGAWDGTMPLDLRIGGRARVANAGPTGRFDIYEETSGALHVKDPVFIFPREPGVVVRRL